MRGARNWRGAAVTALLVVLSAGCDANGITATGPGPKRPRVVSTSAPLACQPSRVVATWTIRRRTSQLVVAPAQQGDVAAVTSLVSTGIGGVILFGSSAPSNLGAQLAALRAHAEGGVAALVMTDEEGGGVQRMANRVGNLPWARTMAATDTAAQVQALAKRTATAMRSLGVTMDLAPVLDLDGGPGPDNDHPDGARSFSPSPQTAASYGLAFARGLLGGGVIPVVKHFPGLGTASGNTDFGPAATAPISYLESRDLLPFEKAVKAGLPAVMVSNASVPGLTSGPASLSKAVVGGLLRHQLGFSGLVLTDSLSAGAITALGLSPAQAAVRSIGAGADMVLYDGSGPSAVRTGTSIVDALDVAVERGTISREVLDNAVLDVLKAKGVRLCP